MSTDFGKYLQSTVRYMPDVSNQLVNNNTQEFLGYMLVSQIETVDAVMQLENKSLFNEQKTSFLEKTVECLQSKFVLMEETINSLKNLVIELKNSNKALPSNPSSTKNDKKTCDNQNPFETLTPIWQKLCTCDTPTKPNDHLAEVPTDGSSLCIYCSCAKDVLEYEKNNETLIIQDEELDDNESEQMAVVENLKKDSKPEACIYCSCAQSKCGLLNKNERIVQEHKAEIQRLFNKRVKYEVNKKFGKLYLREHQVRELDVDEMHKIKKKVVRLFSPFPIPIKTAWNNAMNSLRQDRHQLKKKRSL